MRAEDILADHIGMIDREIKAVFLQRNEPRRLYEMMEYHLGWLDESLKPAKQYRGKRFRPTLCLLTYKALAGVYNKALPAAAAIELIHNFSLIHDDIEDMDEERRHRPTLWKLFGIPHAINAGDGMHVLANLAALRLREYNVTDENIVNVLAILNKTIMELCEGQYLDMSFEERMDIDVASYLDMISRKTAALIEASTYIGAILATRDEEVIQHFRNFGRKIGIAFQIIDDIIGIWEDKTGKPKASDIRNRKKTLPVIYAFDRASQEDKKILTETYAKERLTCEDVERVLEILESTGAKEYTTKMAEKYESEALKELHAAGIKNEAVEKIEVLTEFLIRRKY
ncbi:polyprenyl synthetase family protein [Candidatus Pyrohabitans sp.]